MRFALVLFCGVAVASQAFAQDETTTVDELTITADPLGRGADEVISSVDRLSGDALTHSLRGTLGETMQGLPGVAADTFGGGSARPVIRGQTAPRVEVLTDGAVTLDASKVSPDHAVGGEPLLLRGVEILRGPSALVYGGGAIGGAVNLLDTKIPTRVPDGVEAAGELRMGTADDEQAAVLGVTAGAGNVAFRLEGASRRTSDYAVPFFVPGHEGHDHGGEDALTEEDEEGFDRLPGSFANSDVWSAGLSWVGERGFLGVAWTDERRDYGLPGHLHAFEACHPEGLTLHCDDHDDDHEKDDHAHDEDEPPPVVDLANRRIDVRGEIEAPFAGFTRLRFRGGVSDYRHFEIEDGAIGTTFTNEGHNLRIEAQHAPLGGWNGVIGFQTLRSDFAAIGDESFIAPSRTENSALFIVEELEAGDWRFEGAARAEWQSTRAVGLSSTEHQPLSVSGSASWSFAPGYTASLTLSRSQRAPNVQELYAEGLHLATNTYELGSSTLDEETVVSVEARFRKTDGPFTFEASAYRYDYDGYIYARTLDQIDEFRLIRYSQDDATFTGFEVEARYEVTPLVSLTLFADKVRAKLDDGQNLPRIPAARLGAGADFISGMWAGDLEVTWVFQQDDFAPYESVTPGHTMINATLAYDFADGAQIFVRGTNLLDETVLNHASYLAELAPGRGRSFVLGVRARY